MTLHLLYLSNAAKNYCNCHFHMNRSILFPSKCTQHILHTRFLCWILSAWPVDRSQYQHASSEWSWKWAKCEGSYPRYGMWGTNHNRSHMQSWVGWWYLRKSRRLFRAYWWRCRFDHLQEWWYYPELLRNPWLVETVIADKCIIFIVF